MMIRVYNHLRNARYLGSITILSFGDWIPRERIKGDLMELRSEKQKILPELLSSSAWWTLLVCAQKRSFTA